MKRSMIALCLLALGAPTSRGIAQGMDHELYIVPGAHYSTPARGVVSLTAFFDGRDGIIGKGYIATIEGGRDAFKTHVGMANVSSPRVGYSLQLSAMRTRSRPLSAMPNSTYAGAETHLLVTVVNLGVGYYAPLGDVRGRKGLLSLSIGLGF